MTTTNQPTSVADALKAAKAQATASNNPPAAVETTKPAGTAATSASSDTKVTTPPTTTAPKVKKEKAPRIKVDKGWMEVLRQKVNSHFEKFLTDSPYVAEHGKAQIDFTVANNKGSPVSLTPRIIYADGAIQSPGPKGRLGFCTDKKFDDWFTKVEEKLVVAMERKPRVKGKSPAKQSFWSPIAEKVRVKLGDTFAVRSTGGRMTIKQNVPEGTTDDLPLQASFKQEKDMVMLSSAKGPILDISPVILMVIKIIEGIDQEELGVTAEGTAE